jgi:hypothetical protein
VGNTALSAQQTIRVKETAMNVKRIIILVLIVASLAALSVPTVSAQPDTVTGEFRGEIESISGNRAVISGLNIKINKARLDNDINNLSVGLQVDVLFNLRNGKMRATFIDDVDPGDNEYENGEGEIIGRIAYLNERRVIIGGARINVAGAVIDDDAQYFIGGRVEVFFYESGGKIFASRVNDL